MYFNRFRWPWQKKKPVNQRAEDIAALVEQIEWAKEFQRLIHTSYKIGNAIIMEIEGNGYRAGAIIRPPDPILEYLLNWAAGTRLGYEAELEELIHEIQEEAGKVEASKSRKEAANRPDLDDRAKVNRWGGYEPDDPYRP